MAANLNTPIPVLTEAVDDGSDAADRNASILPEDATDPADRETLIAELQTQIAAGVFDLTDDIMRRAFAEMEASIFEKISSRLRQELPEMVDAALRARLDSEPVD